MRKWLSLLLACVLLLSVTVTAAQAESAYYGIVNGVTANRVNLRANATTNSSSLGVFYTGTPVVCLGDVGGGWTQVYVGTQVGYMMTKYITKTPSALPTGTLLSPASVYAEPQYGTVLMSCAAGMNMTVLGETSGQWYYVLVGGQTGYVPANVLQVNGGSTSGSGSIGTGAAVGYGTAVINGRTADRVNLRAGQSTSAKSLGLYYQGTTVTLRSNARTGWIPVTIGMVDGYISASYLSWDGNVTSKQPTMRVSNAYSSWVNLRTESTTASQSLGRLYNGTTVTVLGETYDHWFYVYTGSQYGYMYSTFLK